MNEDGREKEGVLWQLVITNDHEKTQSSHGCVCARVSSEKAAATYLRDRVCFPTVNLVEKRAGEKKPSLIKTASLHIPHRTIRSIS